MRKYIGYIPAILFTGFYLLVGLTGASIVMSMVMIWLACFWISAFLLHKGLFWGGVFGLFPALHMIYMGTQYTGQVISIEIPLGIAVLLFYVIFGFYLWKKKDTDAPKVENKEVLIMLIKMALTVVAIMASAYTAVISGMILISEGVHQAFAYIGMLVLPSLLLPLIWLKRRKKFIVIWLIAAALYFTTLGVNYGYVKYDESITINTAPNINVHEYLPFKEESKIVKIDSKTLKLTEDLPVIDGAAALFPVYSAFVNAVYPETTKLYDGIFEYNNTPDGYQNLAEKNTDIFIGVYPSEDQKAYAEDHNTTFEYTPIGIEAFVFFVHKDNPIDNLTTEQIQGIYSGEITNWRELGGKNEEIAAFQRNAGSGSQSMLERFMGDKPIMEAPTELVNDLMSGIIEKVSNYRSKSNSIGFSFRYYVEGIIQNPDIKMLSVDGVAPTADNIKNGEYPIVTPIYAVTYEENTNENVDKLLEWILSEEGQYIIEKTGYVGRNVIDEKVPGTENVTTQTGFDVEKILEEAESEASARQKKLQEDPSLTQIDMNTLSYEMYQVWDDVLNELWENLKTTLDEATMDSLLKEQRVWITEKETEVKQASEAVKGGSMAPLVANQKAAELTRTRVYELASYFGYEE